MEDKRLDGIIRIKKTRNFVVMDKGFIEDKRLSYKAKGVLTYLLSRPDNWQANVRDLVEQSKDGKAAVYSALKELEEYGYYKKVPIRNEQGNRILRWESTVYEVPVKVSEEDTYPTPRSSNHSERNGSKEVSGTASLKKCNTASDELDHVSDKFLHSDFKEVEGKNIQNRERNKYINEINNNLNNNYLSCQTDRQPELETTLSVVQENIGYNSLSVSHAEDMALIDEFVSIMVDTIMSKGKIVRIGNEEKPRELVKSALMKLKYSHLVHVLNQFKAYDKRIKKKRQYILSMLYHSSMELKTGIANAVYADWGYA